MTEEHIDQKAKFNMAISTLQSLRTLLDKISQLSVSFLIPEGQRLQMKLNLVKSFFVCASPLMETKNKQEFYDKIMPIRQHTIPEIQTFGMVTRWNGKFRSNYDFNLDIKLNELLVEMQTHLQEKGHFMPPSDEGDLF